MTNKQRIFVGLGLLVSIVFLGFAFSRLEPAEVLDAMREVNPLPVLVGAAFYFTAVSMISLRWQFLLRALRPVPLARLIPLVCIGYMGNNVYPFRTGEALRLWLLQRNEQIPAARATATVIVERIFDGLVMLSFILAGLVMLDVSSPEVEAVLSFAGPLFLVALAVFFFLAAKPDALRWLVGRVTRLLPGKLAGMVSHLSEEFIEGLAGLRSPSDLAGTVIASYLSWMLEAVVYWIVSFAFDFNLSYQGALLVVGVVNLAGLIPASPGQIGVFEYFVSTVLISLGVATSAPATAYALVVHLTIWLPVTLVGFYFLARQGLNWNAIAHAGDLSGQTVTE